MGFSTILDIIGALFIGGSLMLILFRVNDSVAENTYAYGGELTTQQNLKAVVQVLEDDFRKIGYCKDASKIPDPSKSIIKADSSSIKFLFDDKNDGTVDTMLYYLGPSSELNETANPRDRLLYRVVNNENTVGVNLGVTQFKLAYFNAMGDTIKTLPVPIPGQIASIQIDISVEDVSAYNQNYSTSFWKQIRLAARNLNNR